jgi:hypothetical protein
VARYSDGRENPAVTLTPTVQAGADTASQITLTRGGAKQGHRWVLHVPRRRGDRELWLTEAELIEVVALGYRALTGSAPDAFTPSLAATGAR